MDSRDRPTDPAARTRLIRRQEVEKLTDLSRSTIYAWMAEGRFPQSVQVGPHTVRWRLDEVLDFINNLPRSRRRRRKR